MKMQGFRAKPLERIRVAFAGVGGRGTCAVQRIAPMPGIDVVALYDWKDSNADANAAWLKEHGFREPRIFRGSDGWRAMADWDGADVVYIATSWNMHVPIALAALRGGKIPLVEVPAALTLDDCWALVEESEKRCIPCMQLENCFYGEIELLSANMARLGMLGDIVHAEGAYIHDLRWMCIDGPGEGEWRYGENLVHRGNRYPTHGLIPIMRTLGINREDRFDYLVSLESRQAGFEAFKGVTLPSDSPRRADAVAMGDMNTTLIKTKLGRSIMVQHDVSSPRPYSRLQLISGTKGIVADYPFRVALERKPGDGAHSWMDDAEAAKIRSDCAHPFWKEYGEAAKRDGGHDGMDYIMDMRWIKCLHEGVPFDMDVYDLAASCSLCELTEKSVLSGSMPIKVPDFLDR